MPDSPRNDEQDADQVHEIVQNINILQGLAQTETNLPQPTGD